MAIPSFRRSRPPSDFYGPAIICLFPTDAEPQTLAKVMVMRERYKQRCELFHPEDAPLAPDKGYIPEKASQGYGFVLGLLQQVYDGYVEIERKPPRKKRKKTPQEIAHAQANREADRDRKRRERSR